jgi:signal transduction histidine kinase
VQGYWSVGAVELSLSGEAQLYFADGARFGARGGLGLGWPLREDWVPFVQGAIQYASSRAEGAGTAMVPVLAAGLEARF